MNVESIPFSTLSFPKLFQDYIHNFKKLDSFFETNPFEDNAVKKTLNEFYFNGNRQKTVEYLKDYHSSFQSNPYINDSIEKFKDDDTVAVITGQQLTLYGGPLFTIYKIITAIEYARKWEHIYKRPFVPVFWMADEDHDYEEAAKLNIPSNDDIESFFFSEYPESEKRVYDRLLSDKIKAFNDRVRECQFETDFTEKLWSLLLDFYKPEATFGEAFGNLILSLFGHHGLILAGSNSSKAKQITAPVLEESVHKSKHHFKALTQSSDKLLAKGYHNQVHVQESNIFWMDDNNNRLKLSVKDGQWSTDKTAPVRSEDLISDIQKQPDRYSPNVFLRPIIQNNLLPGFAYISGPGETAYYAQMKSYYKQFDLKMPVIVPRFSISIVESSVERIFDKLPFSFSDYEQRIEDLESMYVEKSDSPDIEEIFSKWKKTVECESEYSINKIATIDQTLKGSSEKAIAAFFNELDKLKGKVYRSVKDQEKTQLNRLSKIKNALFPNRNLQEREVAFIYFMNKYGLDVWDDLLRSLKDKSPDNHKIIRF